MIARTKPYALTSFGSALDALAVRVAAAAPAPPAQLPAALDARRLFETMVANPLDAAWSESDAWGGQFDGTRLTVSGPRAMIVAAFQGSSVASLRVDTTAGSWELDFDAAATRVRITDTAGAASDCTFPSAEVHDARDWETTIASVVAGWQEMARAEAAAAAPAPAFELADGSGLRYALSGETRIGRGAACEAMLLDDMASRIHAIVRPQPDGYWIIDNQSLNGTIVNGVRLAQPARLSPGDVLQIGATELVFQSTSGAPPEPAAPAPVFPDEPSS